MIGQLSVAQTFLFETFDSGQWPPWGWSNENPAYWKKSTTNYAGAAVPEACNTITYTSEGIKLISKEINLTEIESINLIFKQIVNYNSGSYFLKVATQSGRGQWHEVWSRNVTGDIAPEDVTINITNTDVGQHDFRFSFYVEGVNEGTIDHWYIDNVTVVHAPVLDCELLTITTPDFISQPTPVSGTIINNGSSRINSLEISWQEGTNQPVSTYFNNLNIDKDEEFSFVCEELIDKWLGNYKITVSVDKVNGQTDDNPNNNTLFKKICIASNTNDKHPVVESFTSSTNSFCYQFNTEADPWFEEHADELTLIKYPVNWPSPGDPYFTNEIGVRVDYYNVISAPNVFIDGEYAGWLMYTVEPAFNEAATLPSVFDIASFFTISGTRINIDTKILPYTEFESLNVQVVVFENNTEENTGTNGETSFKHIVMKMIPDADGTFISVSDREPTSLIQSMNLSETNVEEFNDLGVAIFIQDPVTKEILQSEYSVLNGSFNDDASLSDLLVDGTTIEGFDPSIFYYYYVLPPNSTGLPEVTATTNDTNAIKIILPSPDNLGTININTFAEDLITTNLYTVRFVTTTETPEFDINTFYIYPNPSSGIFNLNIPNVQHLVVYDQAGNVILRKSGNCPSIDLSEYSNGMYYIRVISNINSFTKRVVLTK